MSLSKVSQADAQKIREKCPRFRVLIIGRANAGKTTILQKICNTTERPSVQDPRGRKIDLSLLKPTNMRGLHDVEKEMVFPHNPGFVFHDSRGFESGGADELESVRKFIAKRSKERKLENKIHVIWYCIPTDNSRLLTAAETSFFDDCGTGKVPVIVIFTKFDHGDIGAFCALQEEGLEFEDAKKQAPVRAKADFEMKHLGRIYEKKYPPRNHVYLRDMDKPETDCADLVEETANALSNDTLRVLFVSTQKDNLRLCIKYATKEGIIPFLKRLVPGFDLQEDEMRVLANSVLHWFPYDPENLSFAKDLYSYGYGGLAREENSVAPFLSTLAGPFSARHQALRLGLALTIIGEYSYSLPFQNRLQSSFTAYQASSVSQIINKAVDKIDMQLSEDDLGQQLNNLAWVNRMSQD